MFLRFGLLTATFVAVCGCSDTKTADDDSIAADAVAAKQSTEPIDRIDLGGESTFRSNVVCKVFAISDRGTKGIEEIGAAGPRDKAGVPLPKKGKWAIQPLDPTLDCIKTLVQESHERSIHGIIFEFADVGDPQLELLKDMQGLEWVEISFCKAVSDAGITSLVENESIRNLVLSDLAITDVGIRSLAMAAHLKSLRLFNFDKLVDEHLKLLAIGQFERLWLAELSEVSDDGIASLASLNGLKSLSINSCRNVTGAALDRLSDLQNLTELAFERNKFGEASPSLTGFPALKSFSLSSTVLGKTDLSGLRNLESLRSLDLSSTGISSESLVHLKGLSKLESLRLDRCSKVTNEGLSHIAGLTGLKSLDLRRTAITAAGVAELTALQQLQDLKLPGKAWTDQSLIHIARLPRLQSLEMNAEGKTEVTDEGLKAISGLEHLESVLIYSEKFTDSGLNYLSRLPKLRSLTATSAQITGDGLNGLVNLEVLELNSASVTDEGLTSLNNLPKLKELNVSFCKNITDKGLAHIGKVKTLKKLQIRYLDSLTSVGLQSLAGLDSVEYLNANSCDVADAGLEHLKSLSSLRELHLMGNKITDVGAATFAEMQKLTVLNLRLNSKLTHEGITHLESLPALRTLSLGDCFKVGPEAKPMFMRMKNLTWVNMPPMLELSLDGRKQIREALRGTKIVWE